MKALVVIDMLDDFVYGALASPSAEAVLPALRELVVHARGEGWLRVSSASIGWGSPSFGT